MITRKEAKNFFNDIKKLRELATDAMASEAPHLYPILRENEELIAAGTRINWNGTIKRAAVDLWDRADNNPDNAPSLWEDIDYKLGYRIIPEVITAGTAFTLDECGWWGDTLYRSILNSNVYTPDEYAAGWEIVNI